MRRLLVTCAAGTAAVVLSAPAANAAPPAEHGSCAAFGANVSALATSLGPAFGATASGVASSAPGAFPTLVVHPEQTASCEPR